MMKTQQLSAWVETLFLRKEGWKLVNWDSVVQTNYARVGSLVSVREIDTVCEMIDLVNSAGDLYPRAIRHGDVFSVFNRYNQLGTSHIVLNPDTITDPEVMLGKVDIQVSKLSKLLLCRMPTNFHSFVR